MSDLDLLRQYVSPGDAEAFQALVRGHMSAQRLQKMNVVGVAEWERRVLALRKLAADVKGGKFQTPAELQSALQGLLR